MVDLVIVGTVALDTVETPFGKRERVLGGSASYAATAASYFAKPGIASIIGSDFPEAHLKFLEGRGIDLSGIAKSENKTFFWEGKYEFDLNVAHSLKTELNCLTEFDPVLPEEYRKADYLFLGNIAPELQLKVLGQMEKRPKLVIADTMNFWIGQDKEKVLEVVRKVDIALMNDGEARQLFKTHNLMKAAKEILALDSEIAIIKKGEHGCVLYTKDTHFALPGYPLENVVDPTGAGDSFAGTLLGYLSKNGNLSEKSFRKGLAYASSVASYTAEGFSLEKLGSLGEKDIEARVSSFRDIVRF